MQEKDATTKSFMNKLTAIYEVLCKLLNAIAPTPFTVTGEDCDGAPVTAEATSTVQTVPHPDFIQKVRIECDNKIDPEVVCLSNDGGVTKIPGIVEFDTSTTPSTKTIYLLDNSLATGYSIVPCDTSMQYDYEKENVCVDGQSYTKWYVLDKTGDGLPNLVSILWLDQTDTIVPTPDPLLINNANCGSIQQIGMEQFSGLGNVTQNSTFQANEVTITYDAPLFSNSSAIITVLGTGIVGNAQFEVKPNTQETRKFKYPNITGITISGASGTNITVEFQLN
jgi:hypothetical protein